MRHFHNLGAIELSNSSLLFGTNRMVNYSAFGSKRAEDFGLARLFSYFMLPWIRNKEWSEYELDVIKRI